MLFLNFLRVLISFYQEPDKPGDAVNYLKNTVGGTPEDKKTIEQLRSENTDLKAKVIESTFDTQG